MTDNRQTKDEDFHFDLFRKLYEQKFGKTFPYGEVSHKTAQKPDFLINGANSVIGIEHTELFKNKSPDKPYSPQKEEVFRKKIISDAQKLCERNGIPPIQVNVFFNSLKHICGNKAQFDLSKSIAKSVGRRCNTKKDEKFTLKNPELGLPEIYQIRVIRGTLNGETWLTSHRWQEARASWMNRRFVSELQESIDRKNDRYKEYRKKCEECWLLIVVNRSKDSQAFEITEEMLQHKYSSEFDRTFYMEVIIKDLYELTTAKIQKCV
jgi:hypothetical protein